MLNRAPEREVIAGVDGAVALEVEIRLVGGRVVKRGAELEVVLGIDNGREIGRSAVRRGRRGRRLAVEARSREDFIDVCCYWSCLERMAVTVPMLGERPREGPRL